ILHTWVKLHHPEKTVVGTPLWEDMTEMFKEEGTIDLQGHNCGLHPGGVGASGPCSPESVPGGDAGELWKSGLSGIPAFQTWCGFPVRERRRAMADEERGFRRSKSRKEQGRWSPYVCQRVQLKGFSRPWGRLQSPG
uniref:Uncharacterized protein n=1 Tax=Bos indicus x Bos taurus TaxID=30522 RepID=A0A4W2H748_BOBOX